MTTLPRPDITVNETKEVNGSHHHIAITASRDGKQTTWSGSGASTGEAVKGAVEKMLGDGRTAELLP